MKIVIEDKEKIQKFIIIFRRLKEQVEFINIDFKMEAFYTQGMDSAHVALFELNLKKDWFHTYESEGEMVGLDMNMLVAVLKCIEDSHTLEIYTDDNGDVLNIAFLSDEKGVFNKYYKLPLIDLDLEQLIVPETEWPLDLHIKSQSLEKLVDELSNFGTELKFDCDEKEIKLTSEGDMGKMSVNIGMDQCEEYSIEENSQMNVTYGLKYVQWICQFMKLSENIWLHLSDELPMRIIYKMDVDEENYIHFFLAPKIEDF